MKTNRFLSILACAGLCAALGFGPLLAPSAQAQPNATTAKGAGKDKGAKRGTRVSKRILTAIETKSGKTLTSQQKTQLNAAQKTRAAAIDAARDKFLSEAATITGLSVADLDEIDKPAKNKGAMAPKTGAATTNTQTTNTQTTNTQ